MMVFMTMMRTAINMIRRTMVIMIVIILIQIIIMRMRITMVPLIPTNDQ